MMRTMADRESLTARLQRTLMQVQAGQTWVHEQSASPWAPRPQVSEPQSPQASFGFQRELEASYPRPSQLLRTLSDCTSSHSKQELVPSHRYVATGAPVRMQEQQAWMQQPAVLVAPNSNNTGGETFGVGGGTGPDSQTARTLYRLRSNLSDSSFSDMEAAGSESYAQSGAVWGSDCASSSSYPEGRMNVEAGEFAFTPATLDDSGNCAQPWQQSMAYIGEWLSESGLESHHIMLSDLLAYQVTHSNYVEMADRMASGLVLGQVYSQDPNVDNWMSVHLNAPLPQTPGPETAEYEDVPSSGTATAATPNAEVDSWMSSLLSASSPLTTDTGSPFEQEHDEGPQSLDEVTAMLLELGEAVVADDPNTTELVIRMKRYCTPDGTYLQRLAHYFTEALMAKLNGTGADLFTAIKRDKPSVLETAKALKFFLSTDPTLAIAHHFSNSVLLEAFEGAERVHVVDYGIQNGHQWPILMQTLADRPGGPPRLRITGIEFPQPGINPDGMVKETGRRLSRFAASLRIPFEYKAISAKWEDVQVSSLELREDEAVAVSSVFRLRHLLDDSVVLSNPRRTVLERIRSMNPRVVITAVLNVAGNAPFLMTRLREAIPFFARYFEAFESCTMPRDAVDRQIMEREMLGREILNMIACEGMDRRERPEAYHQWHWRLLHAGFEPAPLRGSTFMSTRDILKYYHEDWTIGHENGWLLSGWKGGVQHASSAWRPAC